ncbi:TauD/TfdA family dioxygenase [Streptomyces olivoreticuli]
MSDATEADLFDSSHVDLRRRRAVQEIAAGIRSAGLVTFSGLASRPEVLGFAEQVMSVARHRDSGPDRLTAIYDTGQHAERPGFAGFTNRELALHTEGSALNTPPRLMLLVCSEPALRGGHTLLADGRRLHADLARRCPDAVAVLSNPRAALFGSSGGIFAPVISLHQEGGVSVRLRQDEFVRWSPLAQMHLHLLRATAARHQQMIVLRAGDGLLLDNHRWLHARTAYEGARLYYRALGSARFSLGPGFLPQRTEPGSHWAAASDAV